MSTVIENGYLVKVKTLEDLNQFIKELRLKIKLCFDKEFTKTVAMEVAEIMDLIALEKLHDGDLYNEVKLGSNIIPISQAIEVTEQNHLNIYKTGIRKPEFDFGFKVQFIPYSSKEYLAMVFAERNSYFKIWEKMAGVSEFSFWNSTDSYPKSVKSRKEWMARGKVWEKFMPRGIPGMCGFTVDCVPLSVLQNQGDPATFKKNVLKSIPTIDERAYRKAKDITLGEVAKEDAEKEGEEITYYNCVGYLTGAEAYLKTEAGKKELETKVKEIRAKLLEINEETIVKRIYLQKRELKRI